MRKYCGAIIWDVPDGLSWSDIDAHAAKFDYRPDFPSLAEAREKGISRADHAALMKASRMENNRRFVAHMAAIGVELEYDENDDTTDAQTGVGWTSDMR